MYYPYFRGKQFELVLLREKAAFLASKHIHPILEPVKNNLSSLNKTMEEFKKNKVEFTLVINPSVGELKTDNKPIVDLIKTFEFNGLSLGYIVDAQTNIDQLSKTIRNKSDYKFSIIHYGFNEGQSLSAITNELSNIKEHIFIDSYTASKLYRKHFKKDRVPRILIRDGFKIMKNAAYPDNEYFSELHITYKSEEGMDGFGDFLIVGDEYNEEGGPAYAVAIHLSYLNKENYMFIYHFKSTRIDSPTDPAGKFLEALEKLVAAINDPHSLIYCSDACKAYKDLHAQQHFPGLGYVKKLSMQHHLELVANFLSKA